MTDMSRHIEVLEKLKLFNSAILKGSNKKEHIHKKDEIYEALQASISCMKAMDKDECEVCFTDSWIQAPDKSWSCQYCRQHEELVKLIAEKQDMQTVIDELKEKMTTADCVSDLIEAEEKIKELEAEVEKLRAERQARQDSQKGG